MFIFFFTFSLSATIFWSWKGICFLIPPLQPRWPSKGWKAYISRKFWGVSCQKTGQLQFNKFSLITDETSDCSTDRTCALVVEYFYKASNEIKTAALDFINLHQRNDGPSGVSLRNILLYNMVGFAADAASNVMGAPNSATSRLKVHMPGVTIFKCVARSIHLRSSKPVKMLPWTYEELVWNYTIFCHSANIEYECKEY